jgi:hypothetical protein
MKLRAISGIGGGPIAGGPIAVHDQLMMTMMTPAATSALHPWERAGLGKAPFRFIGYSHRVGPIRIAQADGTTLEIGAPGQPMGSCAYCGQGIAECFECASFDGRRFIVGCDCIARVEGDERAPLRSMADAAVRKARNARAKTRRAAKSTTEQGELDALLGDDANRARLAALPGPKFGTLLEHAEFMAQRAGAAGRGRALKAVKVAIDKLEI